MTRATKADWDELEAAIRQAGEDNRRLRAVNAELLAALEGMVDEFLAGGGNWHPNDAEALKTARAVLAKARE